MVIYKATDTYQILYHCINESTVTGENVSSTGGPLWHTKV